MDQARLASVQAWGGAGLVSALCLARVAITAGDAKVAITVIPDDAFYYLRLANNFATLGRWTFDGTSPTSGFHLLHAYLLAMVNLVIGEAGLDWRLMFVLISVAAAISYGAASFLLVRVAQRIHGLPSGWLPIAALAGPVVVASSTLCMESHLVVLAGAAVFYAVTRTSVPHAATSVGLVALGFVAALSRADFAVLPGLVWLCCLAQARLKPLAARRATFVFGGVVAGFAATLVHTYLISGWLLPTSAGTKLLWSRAYWSPATLAVPLLFVVSTIALIGHLRWVDRGGRPVLTHALAEPFTVAAVLTLLAYASVYGFILDGFQFWYLTSYVVPTAVVLSAFGQLLRGRLAHVAGLVILASFTLVGIRALTVPLYPAQLATLEAAEILRDDPDVHWFGSTDAGIPSVVSGKTVTNLDGLVDDRAAVADSSGHLVDYIIDRGIPYLLSSLPPLSRTQSADDPRIAQCFEPVRRLGDGYLSRVSPLCR